MADRRFPAPALLVPILIGIALQPLATALHGFPRGLLQGAGLAMILTGVFLLSAHMRKRRTEDGDSPGMWLPSRDEDPR